MQKQITVRYSTGEEPIVSKVFTVDIDDSSTGMNNFISWVIQYNHGNFDDNGDIICKSKIDFLGCQNKALALGLLPKLSPFAIRSRLVIN